MIDNDNPANTFDAREWIQKVERLYTDREKEAFHAEETGIEGTLRALHAYLALRYRFVDTIDKGATGILLLVEDRFSGRSRALKFARPLAGRERFTTKAVEEEGRRLAPLAHPNIIPVHEVNVLEYAPTQRVAFFIMDYVKDAMSLRKRLAKYLEPPGALKQNSEPSSGSSDLDAVDEATPEGALNLVLDLLIGAARGLVFLHANNVIHFDIKPANILVDANGIARIADLGFAKARIGDPSRITNVGFTRGYGHPELFEFKPRPTSDENRMVAELTRDRFKFEWDIYALGKTILELLFMIDARFPDVAIHQPRFRYLHLLACRMLDGRNVSTPELGFFSEFALGLSDETLGEIKYRRATEVLDDLLKEEGSIELSQMIPELQTHSRSTIRVSDTATIFTPRLRSVLDHPLVARLARVSQLGLIRFLYPTASHTRFDHILGTYTNAGAYAVAMYHDPENPLFRQLATQSETKAILLAALLHDLGQYPLAHDLEDVGPSQIFRHGNLTLEFLRNSTVRDGNGHTLQELIEGEDPGWGISLEIIEEILRARHPGWFGHSPFKSRLLSTIIDGPIDADKADYLVRDSRECRLKYGDALDFERLMKTVTVAYDPSRETVSLAIYDKGRPVAESVAFVRYLMFSAVYWHHTSRTYKAMLHHALRLTIETLRKQKDWEVRLKSSLVDFAIHLESKRYKDELLDKMDASGHKSPLAESDVAVLAWLYHVAPPPGRELLFNLACRKLYKRLASIHYSTSLGSMTRKRWDHFQSINRDKHIAFCRRLQESILTEVRIRRSRGDVRETKSISEEKFSRFEELMAADRASILLDVPEAGRMTGTSMTLVLVKETMQRRYLDDVPTEAHLQMSDMWLKHNEDLMRSAAVVRVLCHPEVQAPVKAVLSTEAVLELAIEASSE